MQGVRATPSQANYILCRLERGTLAELRAHMEARGVLLRYYGRGALEQCLRISVGTPEQNETIASALEEFVCTREPEITGPGRGTWNRNAPSV